MPPRPKPPPLVIGHSDHDRLAALADAASARTPRLAATLLSEIERSRVVPEPQLPSDVVRMGSVVTFRDEATAKVQSVRLVYPAEADIAAGRVSILTPIGTALIGLTKGQSMSWQTLSGEDRQLTVLGVEQPSS
ncbi:MAG: nucleoside diphosphate kinase regulator [Bauldia sp.]